MEDNSNAVARLADPEALASAALEGETVEVVMRVPVGAFASAYKLLRPIMDDGAPDLEVWLTEKGRSEDELRLLCALLCTVADNLPMDTKHVLAWQEKVGVKQYLDEFATARFGNMNTSDDPNDAAEAIRAVLEGKCEADLLNALSASDLDLGEIVWNLGVGHFDLDNDFMAKTDQAA